MILIFLWHTVYYLLVEAVQLCIQECWKEMKVDGVTRGCPVWDLWETEWHPGMDLSKAELSA